MYVFHPFILTWLQKAGLPNALLGPMTIVATYLAACASWVLLEKWFLRLKRYFEYGSGRSVIVAREAKKTLNPALFGE
jgi:peptidoglycan/LPS O-acetylase OafA/YrhL